MAGSPVVVVTTSWDDGDPLDLKLAEVLSAYGVSGTFYIAPRNRERVVMDASALRLLGQNFEIGAHTLTHPNLRRLNSHQLNYEIRGCKSELEDVLGKPVRMFAYPKGKFNRRVHSAVVNAGYIGARTIKEFYLNPGTDVYRIPTTIWAYQLPIWIRLRHELRTGHWHGIRTLLRIGPGKKWVDWAKIMFEEALEQGGVWHLYGHSWEIEKYNLWGQLQEVLEVVSGYKDVKYLTNADLIRMVFESP